LKKESQFLAFCQRVRAYELGLILPTLPPNQDLLEIGAGAGWQARQLMDAGYTVSAVDIAGSFYESSQVFPVKQYDGRKLPYDDESFDIVFTSNVLEHVVDLEALHSEVRRVLRPHGLVIHVLPSASWRMWSVLAFYFRLPSIIGEYLRRQICRSTKSEKAIPPHSSVANYENVTMVRAKRRPSNLLLKCLWSERHGERGNRFTELFYLRRKYWANMFEGAGWKLVSVRPNRLFYSGECILGNKLNMDRRRYLASLFGNSCWIYTLTHKSTKSIA
jgi:2-polyprenyl-3-methyl-5-hydroxy-6-metoxy-1,4-benzoquinol methylase